jgi:hypothetical protein
MLVFLVFLTTVAVPYPIQITELYETEHFSPHLLSTQRPVTMSIV